MATTYAEWYNLPENDPYHGDYSTLFPVFAVNRAGNVGNGVALRTSLAVGADTKAALVFLSTTGKIHLIHRVRRYTPALGMPATAYDDLDFGTFNELTPTGPSTVELPNDLLAPLVAAPVLTADEIDNQIAATPNAFQHRHDPVALPLAAVADVRTRPAMVVPPHLTGRLLAAASAPTGLTPRDLWTQFIIPLRPHPHFASMTPFVDWARMAYANDIGPLNSLAVVTPHPLHLDPTLGTERSRLYAADLPHLTPGAPNVAPLVAELAATRMDAAARETQRRLLDIQQKAAAVLPSKRWGNALSRLLRLCQVGAETDLPPVWLDMAQHGVKSDINTIRSHLYPPQPELGPSGLSTPPVCTSEMAKAVGRLEFQTHPNAIETGIHIFGICHPTQASVVQANEIAGLFAEQIQGVTGLTVAENVAFKKAQALLLPTSLLELKHVLFGYHRFLAVLFGPDHPIVRAFGFLTVRLQDDEMELHLYFLQQSQTSGSFLRFIQLRMYYWIETQLKTDDIVPAPDFTTVLSDIALDCWKPPKLPPAYLVPAVAPSVNKVPPLSYAAAAAAVPVHANAIAPSPPNPPRADALFNADRALLDPLVRNMPGFHPVRFLEAHGPPPLCDHGGEMCLNFHVRKKCRSSCPRAIDHVKHTPAETTRLNAYLNSPMLVVPAAPIAPPVN